MANTVSIIMATYNRGYFIGESLKYIVKQSFSDFECLIIDDGSTDTTAEIVNTLTKIDNRFNYFHRPKSYKKGLPGCRNYGLDLAKGKYIVFFDDDDIPHPNLLEWAVKEIKAYNADYCRYLRNVFSGTFIADFDLQNNYVVTKSDASVVEKMVTGKLPFNSCQVLWKKTCFDNLRFNEELMFAEEWECYTRILLRKKKGISLEKALYYGRKHANSNTGEFRSNDPVRKASKIKAVKLVIENLKSNSRLSPKLTKYFINLGFLLKEREIINFTLAQSNAMFLKKIKYKLGFWCYPLLKPLLNLKGKILKH